MQESPDFVSYYRVNVSLVMSKTKVALIKRLTIIPRLDLCGANLLAGLLHHIRGVFNILFSDVHAWTDRTVVLHWLAGNPCRFKTFVGNRVLTIMDLTPPDRWHHVSDAADSAS